MAWGIRPRDRAVGTRRPQTAREPGGRPDGVRRAPAGAARTSPLPTWGSTAGFLRSGFGVVAHDTDQIVSWCLAEYVSGRKCGVGIETIGRHRGRGFATLTASAFVEKCAERQVTPYWDSWVSNRPSRTVAERVGFQKIGNYWVWLGDFGDVRVR
jgi:GNAT superfamily N-acetyltransferase